MVRICGYFYTHSHRPYDFWLLCSQGRIHPPAGMLGANTRLNAVNFSSTLHFFQMACSFKNCYLIESSQIDKDVLVRKTISGKQSMGCRKGGKRSGIF